MSGIFWYHVEHATNALLQSYQREIPARSFEAAERLFRAVRECAPDSEKIVAAGFATSGGNKYISVYPESRMSEVCTKCGGLLRACATREMDLHCIRCDDVAPLPYGSELIEELAGCRRYDIRDGKQLIASFRPGVRIVPATEGDAAFIEALLRRLPDEDCGEGCATHKIVGADICEMELWRGENRDGRVFVACCDMCNILRDDLEAAEVVSRVTGWPIQKDLDDPANPEIWRPYFAVTLAEAERVICGR